MSYEVFIQYLPNLLIILAIFTIGVASPGPATLMILGTAMSRGRSSAIALSFGVVTGSMFWGCVTAFGFISALKASADFFMAMKLAGALYLSYLAFRSLRSALTPGSKPQVQAGSVLSLQRYFIKGLLLHLTNPKAPLVWLATLSVGLGDAAPMLFLVTAVVLCEVAAITVFVGYAFLFSTTTASQLYLSFRRPFDATMGVLFGAAAIKILASKAN